jgi:hypothetical protein
MPWLPEQMIKALRQAVPEMLRNNPKLAAEDNEGPVDPCMGYPIVSE